MKCDLFILVLASVVQQWRACNAAPLGQSGAPRVKHVVHIGIDGLKPDCLFRDTDGAPNILKRLGNKGTWTLTRSRTTIETVSAPGWSASLCGMSPVSTGKDSSIIVNLTICNDPAGGGGHSGTEGGRTRVTYFAEEGVFFKTSACPRFCKRRVLFCTQVRSMGVKTPLQSTKYTRL